MPAAATDYFQKVGLSTATTLSSPGYTIGGTSINVASTTNWPTDTGITFAIDEVDGSGTRIAGTYNVFRGTVSSATQINGLVYVGGDANRNYSAGATTRVYITVSSYRDNRMVDGLVVEHKQTGAHSDVTADSITVTDLTVTGDLTVGGVGDNGWVSTGGTHSVATGYNSGNRSFLIDTTTDLTGIVSPGMRYRTTRNTTPPTQCADLEASSSHYASKTSPTGITFTDDFTCEAWIKLESYTGARQVIVGRWDNGNNFWMLSVESTGQLALFGCNTAGNDNVTSYQSVPLNKWVHVAAHMDISGTAGKTYIDGVEVPNTYTNSTTTAVGQAGDISVGRRGSSGTEYFDGKLADVRVWSDIRTADEIRDNMYAYPSDTTGLVAHFKLNGDFTDASSNGNDLTAQNSAVATNADNPWNATEYGIITNVTASTIQVFCPSGYGIPNETLTAPFYSTQSAPFGFPRDKGLWDLTVMWTGQSTAQTATATTWYNLDTRGILLPIGAWNIGFSTVIRQVNSSAGVSMPSAALSTSTNSVSDSALTQGVVRRTSTTASQDFPLQRNKSIAVSAVTNYYLLAMTQAGAGTITLSFLSSVDEGHTTIVAEFNYL